MANGKLKEAPKLNYARVAAAKLIGRQLTPDERVAFRDGDRSNVAADNLMVFANNSGIRRWRSSSNREVGLVKQADGTYVYDSAIIRKDRVGKIKKNLKKLTKANVIACLKKIKNPSLHSVAMHLDVSTFRARTLLNQYGLTVDQFVDVDDERNQLLSKLANNTTLQSIMNEFKMSRTALATRFKWLGINFNSGVVSEVPRVEVPADVLRLGAKYFSIYELSDYVGTYPAVISELGRRYGINIRRSRQSIIPSDCRLSRSEIEEIVERGRSAGVSGVLAYYAGFSLTSGVNNRRYTYWNIRRAMYDTEAFIEQNELTESERDLAFEKLHGLAGKPTSSEVGDGAVMPVDELTAVTPSIAVDDGQPTRRIAKRDLSALMATGVGVQRIARIINVSESTINDLVQSYHLNLEDALAPARSLLTPASVSVFRQTGRSPREIADFLGLKPAVVRLLMHVG